jgi:hypothetical protein
MIERIDSGDIDDGGVKENDLDKEIIKNDHININANIDIDKINIPKGLYLENVSIIKYGFASAIDGYSYISNRYLPYPLEVSKIHFAVEPKNNCRNVRVYDNLNLFNNLRETFNGFDYSNMITSQPNNPNATVGIDNKLNNFSLPNESDTYNIVISIYNSNGEIVTSVGTIVDHSYNNLKNRKYTIDISPLILMPDIYYFLINITDKSFKLVCSKDKKLDLLPNTGVYPTVDLNVPNQLDFTLIEDFYVKQPWILLTN